MLGLAIGAAALFGRSLESPAQAVADAAAPPASIVTADIEQRVVAQQVLLRGTVAPGASTTLTVPAGLAGPTSVVTAVPGRVGQQLRDGSVLLEVDGAPVFGLVLPFPLYRDLSDGLSGPDVREVQKALARMGYPTAVTGVVDAGTEKSLQQFYRARGYQVPRQAASVGTSGVANGSTAGPPAAPAKVPAGQIPSPPAAAAAPMLPRADVIRLDRVGHTVSALPVGIGAVLSDPTTVLAALDTGPNTVSAVATQDQLAVLTVGASATVVDDTRGATAAVVVASVGTQPQQSDQGTGFPVRFSFTGNVLDPTPQYTVRVTVGSTAARALLAVPVTAVYSRPDGSTFVTIVTNGSTTNDIAVQTKTSAGGWVQISAPDSRITVGTHVMVGAAIGAGTSGAAKGKGGG